MHLIGHFHLVVIVKQGYRCRGEGGQVLSGAVIILLTQGFGSILAHQCIGLTILDLRIIGHLFIDVTELLVVGNLDRTEADRFAFGHKLNILGRSRAAYPGADIAAIGIGTCGSVRGAGELMDG